MNVLEIYGDVTTMQHDAAATIMVDGKVIACVEEERLSRIKHAYGQVPVNAIAQVLKIAGLDINEIDLVCHAGEKHPDLPQRIKHYMEHEFGMCPKLRMFNHQDSHIASSFYMSDFDEAMVIYFDGTDERESKHNSTLKSYLYS
jgi:carbamoyltransferase